MPNDRAWRFDKIEARYPDRARALKMAPAPDKILECVCKALRAALLANDVRFGYEQCDKTDDRRVVVQFRVDPTLFDFFFNARTGYRAHFRAGIETGLAFNSEVIKTVRNVLTQELPESVTVRLLDADFEYCENKSIERTSITKSLDLYLSKVWFCTKLIGANGPTTDLALGVTGPKLEVDNLEWSAIYRDPDDSWFDVKGAFLGIGGPYQLKDPKKRAKSLHDSGEA